MEYWLWMPTMEIPTLSKALYVLCSLNALLLDTHNVVSCSLPWSLMMGMGTHLQAWLPESPLRLPAQSSKCYMLGWAVLCSVPFFINFWISFHLVSIWFQLMGNCLKMSFWCLAGIPNTVLDQDSRQSMTLVMGETHLSEGKQGNRPYKLRSIKSFKWRTHLRLLITEHVQSIHP